MGMEKLNWEIYTLSDPRTQEVRYVGVTTRRRKRYLDHVSAANRGGKTHRDCWIRSLLAQGHIPVYQTIERGTGGGWQEAEQRWIATYRGPFDLTNLTDGGDGITGYVPTPELRQKWSRQRAGVKYPPHRVPGMLGKKHTPETIEKIRAAGLGRKLSEEAKQKISKKHKGRTLSEEQRQRLAELHRGTRLSEEHKQKIAAATTSRKPVRCVETEQVFASITETAAILGVTEASINQAIRKGCRCKGNHLQFA